MAEILARRSLRQAALPEALEVVHSELDAVWEDAPFVPELDRMTFATAVIEAASNVIQHAVPETARPVEIGVDLIVTAGSLEARVSAFGAANPAALDAGSAMPDADAESGRGLALIHALVTTVTFRRENGTNTWILTKSRLED
ncbi:ATP-binding protein [Arthrobacter sp. NPDC080031]|uniref:ATP-binding protein n=1 Tax=Arthrobacter sp. NPDC080031 TaxID=3155918 RepID=UPI00344DBB3D